MKAQHPYSKLIILEYVIRSMANVLSVFILWLALRVNNNKYLCFCKWLHSCVLRCCMNTDPSIIHEGFANEGRIRRRASPSFNEMIDRRSVTEEEFAGGNLMVTSKNYDDTTMDGSQPVMVTGDHH